LKGEEITGQGTGKEAPKAADADTGEGLNIADSMDYIDTFARELAPGL